MSEAPEKLWVAEFSGKHIEGNAYLAMPNPTQGFDIPYRRADWRLIETAPRDGSIVLVWNEIIGIRQARYSDETERWHALPLWPECSPTHWQPQPETPA